MSYFYITHASVPSSTELKEVDSSGNLVSGGKTITGSRIGATLSYSYHVEFTRFYTLYVDGSAVANAATMFLVAGDLFESNEYNQPKAKELLDMNNNGISNISDGAYSGDAVAYNQIESLISTTFPTLPAVSLDQSTYLNHAILSIASPTDIPKDMTIIFYYNICPTSAVPTISISANGVVSSSVGSVIQMAVKTPYCVLPKIGGWTADYYINFGYYLQNSAAISSAKTGTQAQVGSTWIGIDSLFADMSSVTPSTGSLPILTDLGNSISVTIPADEQKDHANDFEIAYGFLATGSTDPTISTNTITNLPNYIIQRSSTRTFIIPKPLLSSTSGEYKIWVTYRFVTPFTISNWWRAASTNKLKDLAVSKFSQKINIDDIDAIASYIANYMYADVVTGTISRK